jgi:hypothetical protein
MVQDGREGTAGRNVGTVSANTGPENKMKLGTRIKI